MYRNVMVPIDGSSFSREAVLQGLRIASRCGATLRLVRVAANPAPIGAPEGFVGVNLASREIHNSALAELYSIAADCRAHSTINVTASIEHGPVVDALIGYAKRFDVDLIVMRSHARSGLSRAWFGSVADGLIRMSGIPVMVLRQPSLATGLESGLQMKRILVPLDGSPLAEESLRAAGKAARVDGASLTLLRVVAPSVHRVGGDLESDIGPANALEVGEARHYLASLFTSGSERFIGVKRRVVISDDIAGSILSMAAAEEADLIAIATRGRGSLARATNGSVSDRVMREAQISTLVVHPTAQPVDFIYASTAVELAGT
ncbi:MAG: universal stress protein [Gemmatimonadales bacterium]